MLQSCRWRRPVQADERQEPVVHHRGFYPVPFKCEISRIFTCCCSLDASAPYLAVESDYISLVSFFPSTKHYRAVSPVCFPLCCQPFTDRRTSAYPCPGHMLNLRAPREADRVQWRDGKLIETALLSIPSWTTMRGPADREGSRGLRRSSCVDMATCA